MEWTDNTPEVKISKVLLNKQVYNILFDWIVEDRLKPGTKLSVAKLSEELGVSRSPVAAALSSLERDGYLEIKPQYGTFVRELTFEELDVIYQARAALERVVVLCVTRKASHRRLMEYRQRFEAYQNMQTFTEGHLREIFDLDIELHNYFAEFLPEVVCKEYTNICNLTRRSRLLNLNHSMQNKSSSFVSENIVVHIKIIDAMLQGDVGMAISLVEEDVLSTRDNVLKIKTFSASGGH